MNEDAAHDDAGQDEAWQDEAWQDEALEAYMDAAAAFQGLTIASAWRADVRDNLKAIAAAARLVLDFPLDDAVEAAPIYQP